MKLQGIVGTGSGKLGASVFVVRHGEQIVRTYQPVVSDAKSASQLVVRAKMKLMVQLAAVLAAGLGFRRIGNVSPRNRFFTANYSKVTMDGDEAKIAADVLDISGGVSALGMLSVAHAEGNVDVSLTEVITELDRVVYVVVEKTTNGSYIYRVLTAEEGNGYFPAQFSFGSSRTGYILAYGVKFLDKAAHVKFNNLTFDDPNYAVEYLRTLYESQVELTTTQYASIPAQA